MTEHGTTTEHESLATADMKIGSPSKGSSTFEIGDFGDMSKTLMNLPPIACEQIVIVGMVSLQQVLDNTLEGGISLERFRQYCQRHLCEENLQFHEAYVQFRKDYSGVPGLPGLAKCRKILRRGTAQSKLSSLSSKVVSKSGNISQSETKQLLLPGQAHNDNNDDQSKNDSFTKISATDLSRSLKNSLSGALRSSMRRSLGRPSVQVPAVLPKSEDLDQLHRRIKELWATYFQRGSTSELNVSKALWKRSEQVTLDMTELFPENYTSISLEDYARTFVFCMDTLNAIHTEVLGMLDGVFKSMVKEVSVKKRLHVARDIALWCFQPEPFDKFWEFPSPINEAESRCNNIMAALIVSCAVLVDYSSGWNFPWLYFFVIWDYFAKVISGPRLSPLSWIALFVAKPTFGRWFKNKFVAAPPKRFAVAIGLSFSVIATSLRFIFPATPLIMFVTWAALVLAASIAGIVNFCVGCFIFQMLMYLGIIPKETCEECAINYT
jgi:hypothetical protein